MCAASVRLRMFSACFTDMLLKLLLLLMLLLRCYTATVTSPCIRCEPEPNPTPALAPISRKHDPTHANKQDTTMGSLAMYVDAPAPYDVTLLVPSGMHLADVERLAGVGIAPTHWHELGSFGSGGGGATVTLDSDAALPLLQLHDGDGGSGGGFVLVSTPNSSGRTRSR